MKKQSFLVILLSVLLVGTSFAQNKQTRSVDSFDEIKVGGAFDVILEKGSKESVELQGNERDLERVIVEVTGKTLRIRKKNGYDRWRMGKIVVYVTFENLESIHSSGASDISSKDIIKASDFEVRCSGAGDVDLRVEARSLDVTTSGSADVKLEGSADRQSITVSGSSDIDLFDLKGRSCDITISGSGNADVNVSESLSVRVSGSGDVRFRGNPDIQNFKVSGSGSVRKAN